MIYFQVTINGAFAFLHLCARFVGSGILYLKIKQKQNQSRNTEGLVIYDAEMNVKAPFTIMKHVSTTGSALDMSIDAPCR